MPNIGPMELIVVLIIGLVVLGPKRLPDAGRALGDGIRGFKSSLTGTDPADRPHEVEAAASVPAPAAAARDNTRQAA
jgi:sec-independent protein translocase protein TatA